MAEAQSAISEAPLPPSDQRLKEVTHVEGERDQETGIPPVIFASAEGANSTIRKILEPISGAMALPDSVCFVRQISTNGQSSGDTAFATGTMTVTEKTPCVQDHFEVLPGTMQVEVAQQVLGLLAAHTAETTDFTALASKVDGIKLNMMASVGDTIEITVQLVKLALKRDRANGLVKGSATLRNVTDPQRGETTIEEITLLLMPKATLETMLGEKKARTAQALAKAK